jgi:hypothetical protein
MICSAQEVEDLPAQRAIYIGDALEYACQFWASHLVECTSSGPDVEEVHKAIDEFFTTVFCFGLKSLASWRSLIGVYALKNIDQWYMQVSHM